MKTTFTKKSGAICLGLLPVFLSAQIDLAVGLNYSYNPPNNCNNQITSIAVDVCNNGSGAITSSFLVGMYLYDPGSSNHWVLDQTTINSMSGNSIINITNWNINMNNYQSLPAPGTNYRLGIWIDTANVITETSKSNNSGLLSGNIQVCAPSGIIELQEISAFKIYPNPSSEKSEVYLSLVKEEKINISVFDLTGKIILNVFDGNLPAGEQKITFPTTTMTDGIYFLNVRTSSGIITKKLVVYK